MSMSNTQRGETVVGVFEDRERAREAIEALKDAGFEATTISILSPDRAATREIAEDTGTHAGSGAATGALAGGVLGGLGGWLVGIGALAIPGVGPFIAAGAFATALGGAAIGAGVGAIAGALVGMGVPEEHAKYYEGEARAGRTLVTVRAANRYDEAQEILRDHDAYDVESRSPTTSVTIDRTPVEARPSDRPIDESHSTISVAHNGDVAMAGRGSWDQVMPGYRQRWQERYGTGGDRWEDVEPGYRYGYEMRDRPEYRGRMWADVEPEMRRDWSTRHPESPWERAKEAVRETWESAARR